MRESILQLIEDALRTGVVSRMDIVQLFQEEKQDDRELTEEEILSIADKQVPEHLRGRGRIVPLPVTEPKGEGRRTQCFPRRPEKY